MSNEKYICKLCNYTTNRLDHWKKHINSYKHHCGKNRKYECICGKKYIHSQSLSRHKIYCNVVQSQAIVSPSFFVTSLDAPDQKFDTMVDLMRTMLQQNHEMIQKMVPSKIINNTQNNTNNFNLHFFLNETCKNAMNIHQFMNSLDINLNHMDSVIEYGLPCTLSNIVSDALDKLHETERPIHCTDIKRQIFYVNAATEDTPHWVKDEKKDILYGKIKGLSNFMIRLIDEWSKENPGYQTDDKVSMVYLKLVKNLMDTLETSRTKMLRTISQSCKLETKIQQIK